jgi:6-phosphogluconolactonase (cycloisomerase 2 family)
VVNNSGNTLQVFNVSNPASPTLSGSVATGKNPYSVCVQGSYAYVANYGGNTLQVFNVSNPASPSSVGSAATGTYPSSVFVQGDYAYVVNRNSATLQVFNVSNPASPSKVGSAATGSVPMSVCVQGGYAYVANEYSNSLQVFNVSNPASPSKVGSVSTGTNPISVSVQGEYAYVVNYASDTLQVFNVASATFNFAEGTCRPGFDTYICIQNPGTEDANVMLTYMKGDGTTATDTVTVPKSSRATVSPRTKLGTADDPAHDFSTTVTCTNGQKIVAERPMYFLYNGVWTGGHDVVGATSPSSTFYFAEGTCRPGFDPYFCLQNPGRSEAEVTLTYMKGDGTMATDAVTVPGNSRATVSPRTKLGTSDDDAHDFSAKVECTNGQQIVAERPMYFLYKGVWSEGHDVVGATSPSSTFYFAEGTCRPGFDPYFCLQNPGTAEADVTLTYMKGDGTTASDTVIIPGNSRATISPRTKLGTADDPARDFSAKVECTNGQQIVAERPMYVLYKGVWKGGHDVMGATSPSSTCYFAEGTCRPGFDPYFCLQNPGSTDAKVTLTYIKGDGKTSSQNITVPAESRRTVHPADVLGTSNDAAHDFSAKVECTNGQQIVAERPMYFDYKGWIGGSDAGGFVPPPNWVWNF